MGKGVKPGGVLVACKANPLMTQLTTSYKVLETHLKNWYDKHAFVDVTASAIGAVYAGSVSYVIGPRNAWPGALESKMPLLPILIGGGALTRARNAAIITGVYTGIYCVMERSRGKVIQTSLAAGFGAGVIVSLVCGTSYTTAITNGLFLGLTHGGVFKVKEKFRQPKDVSGNKMRGAVSSYGRDQPEKDDKTLPLLTDREEAKKGGTRR